MAINSKSTQKSWGKYSKGKIDISTEAGQKEQYLKKHYTSGENTVYSTTGGILFTV